MLKEIIANNFTLSFEVVPPRNGEVLKPVIELLRFLKGKADFVSVTESPMGSLRAGTIALSHFANSLGLPAAAHVICLGKTQQMIENQLLELHYLGIRQLLALRGDYPVNTEVVVKPECCTIKLIEQIKRLNHGLYLKRGKNSEFRKGLPTEFFVFVAGHPEWQVEKELRHMKAKQDAGADAIITQMCFSEYGYAKYLRQLRGSGITLPVVAGIRPVTSTDQLIRYKDMFKVEIPPDLLTKLKRMDKESAREYGLTIAVRFYKAVKSLGYAGAHFFCFNDKELISELLNKLDK